MEQSLIILLRLLVAHTTSDFILQSDRMRDGKRGGLENQATHKNWYLAYHSLIHAIVSYIFVAQWGNWIIPLTIFLTHLIIDWLKSTLNDKLLFFAIDQILHIIVILLLWVFIFGTQVDICTWLDKAMNNEQVWIILLAYIFVTKPTSIIFNLFFSTWEIGADLKGLPGAGKWIGYLERVLVLTFVITSQIEMIGFLIAAKSIFRFGELKDANQIKNTEYILIGTLASFTVAIISGIIVNLLIKLIVS